MSAYMASSATPLRTTPDGAKYTVKQLPLNERPGIAYRQYEADTPAAIAVPTVELKFGADNPNLATLLVAMASVVTLVVEGYWSYLHHAYAGMDQLGELEEHFHWVSLGLTDHQHVYLSKGNFHALGGLIDQYVDLALVRHNLELFELSDQEYSDMTTYFKAAVRGLHVTEKMCVHVEIEEFDACDQVHKLAVQTLLAELCAAQQKFPGAYQFNVIIKVPYECEIAIRDMLDPRNTTGRMTAAQALTASRVRNWQFAGPDTTTTYTITTNRDLAHRPTFIHLQSRLHVEMEV